MSFMKKMLHYFVLCLFLMFSALTSTALKAAEKNPYPTIIIADYVFGCMASNGQTRQALERCSCSIDVISSIVTYADYEKAETVLSLRRLSGEKSALYKTAAQYKNAVDVLKRAQAEAEVRCF
ncbi:MAG: hypothetical protein ACRBBJ_11095 [Rhodomicrobiaceae bacterium]